MHESFRICRCCGCATRFVESLHMIGTALIPQRRETRQCPSCGLYVEMTEGKGGYHVTWYRPFEAA